jgi:hypothetical protein
VRSGRWTCHTSGDIPPDPFVGAGCPSQGPENARAPDQPGPGLPRAAWSGGPGVQTVEEVAAPHRSVAEAVGTAPVGAARQRIIVVGVQAPCHRIGRLDHVPEIGQPGRLYPGRLQPQACGRQLAEDDPGSDAALASADGTDRDGVERGQSTPAAAYSSVQRTYSPTIHPCTVGRIGHGPSEYAGHSSHSSR